jgi:hypothetical protein
VAIDAQARPLLARALSEGGTFDELLDPRLENNVDRLELERMCAAAAAAVRHSAKRRPKMKQVSCSLNFVYSASDFFFLSHILPMSLYVQIVRALEGDALLDDLNEGVKPGQSMMFSSSSEYDAGGGNYTSDMSRFRKVAFESGEYSNEYGATSESGEAVATRRQQHH